MQTTIVFCISLFVLQVLSFSNGAHVAIQSVAFPNVFLRVDGSGCTTSVGPGCGIVNTQYLHGPYEEFILHQNADGNWCIESNQFRNAYLRMDGSGISSSSGSGGGIVNAQYYAAGTDCGGYEEYTITSLPNGQFGIQSVAFPGRYLRVDGSGVTSSSGPGEGIVNLQYYTAGATPGGYEVFTFVSIGQSIQNLWSGRYLAMDAVGNFISQASPFAWTITNVPGSTTSLIQIANPNTNIYPSFPWFLTTEDDSGFRAVLSGGPSTANWCQWVITPVSGGNTLSNVWLTSLNYGYLNLYYYDDYDLFFSYTGGGSVGNKQVWVFAYM